MQTIVAITTPALWRQAKATGQYRQSTITQGLDQVGFIHCSTPDQTLEIVNRRFGDQPAIVLLLINADKVTAPVKFEGALSGRAGLFPHIYGPLNTDAVYRTIELTRDPSGHYEAPAGF